MNHRRDGEERGVKEQRREEIEKRRRVRERQKIDIQKGKEKGREQ